METSELLYTLFSCTYTQKHLFAYYACALSPPPLLLTVSFGEYYSAQQLRGHSGAGRLQLLLCGSLRLPEGQSQRHHPEVSVHVYAVCLSNMYNVQHMYNHVCYLSAIHTCTCTCTCTVYVGVWLCVCLSVCLFSYVSVHLYCCLWPSHSFLAVQVWGCD